jgi:RNA polymerase sigma factor (sigma-70 family)
MTEDLLRNDPRCRKAFKAGERWAMAAVYRSYLPLIRTVTTHGFGNFKGFFDPVDRDDAVQNIFAVAFEERSRLRYNGIDPYGSFLRGIAHNVVRKMLDKKTRFDRRPDSLHEESTNAETEYIKHETANLLRGFREQVTDEPDKTVLQRYFCDGTAEETLAKDLGITRHKVRKSIARLHSRMIKLLKSHGITHA